MTEVASTKAARIAPNSARLPAETDHGPKQHVVMGDGSRRSFFDRLWAARPAEAGPLPVIVGVVAIWIFFQAQNTSYLSARNLSNLITQMAVTAILAMAVVLVLVAGEIDLSLGSVTGVTSAVLGVLLTNDHWPAGAALLAALALGLGIGLVQGAVTAYVGVPSFLVTLGGFLAWAGLQLSVIGPAGDLPVTNGTITAIGNDYLAPWVAWLMATVVVIGVGLVEVARRRSWRRAGMRGPHPWQAIARVVLLAAVLAAIVAYLNDNFGVPYLLVVMLALAAGLGWTLRRTIFGRYLYAVGGNAEASRRAGVPLATVRVAVLGLSGLLGGVAGIVSTSNLFATSAGVGGSTLLLEAIAAAVIGGASLFGGRGHVYQALLGALVIASIENGLYLLGKSASTVEIATGVILVLAVSVDAASRRRRAAAGR
ncbi:MAG: sugar ABC transporter permease [Actinomycetota bacterium]|nr:sugar ABC transporter permease [Actinomycetota bacterium]